MKKAKEPVRSGHHAAARKCQLAALIKPAFTFNKQGPDVTVKAVTHLNFRGEARAALAFYQSVFDGAQTVVSYRDAGRVEKETEADQVMWGQVTGASGFQVMAYDVPSSMPWDPGQIPFFIVLRGNNTDELSAYWDKLANGATILVPLAPAFWSQLYGMLKDRFGITWVLDIDAS